MEFTFILKGNHHLRLYFPFDWGCIFPFLYKALKNCLYRWSLTCRSSPRFRLGFSPTPSSWSQRAFFCFPVIASLSSTWDCKVLWPFETLYPRFLYHQTPSHPLLPLELIPLRVLCYITAHDLAFNLGIQGFKFVSFLILLYIFSLLVLSMSIPVNAFQGVSPFQTPSEPHHT